MLSLINFYYADIYSIIGKRVQSEQAIKLARMYYGNNFKKDADLAFIGNIYQRLHNIDSVKYYINLCNQDPYYLEDVAHLSNQKWLAKQYCDYEYASELSDSIQTIHNRIIRTHLATQESIAQADFYIELAKHQEMKSSKISSIATKIVFSLLGIISAIIAFLFKKRQAYKISLSEKYCQMEQYKKEIEVLKNTINHIKTSTQHSNAIIIELKRILVSEYGRLNKQLNNYNLIFEQTNNAKSTNQLLTKAKFKKFDSEELIANVIEYINIEHNNLIEKLQNQVPQLKPFDIHFIALKLSGFSSNSICLIQQISSTTYYTRWFRLRAKISQCNATDKELFMKIITNL